MLRKHHYLEIPDLSGDSASSGLGGFSATGCGDILLDSPAGSG